MSKQSLQIRFISYDKFQDGVSKVSLPVSMIVLVNSSKLFLYHGNVPLMQTPHSVYNERCIRIMEYLRNLFICNFLFS